LESGGPNAVELAKNIAKDAGKELSSDEIQSIFAPQVARLVAVRDALDNISKGQYVDLDSELYDILNQVNMIDTSGFVTNMENLAEAYLKVYE